MHDVVLAHSAGELGRDATLVQHVDAGTHGEHLRKFGRDHEDRGALRRELPDAIVGAGTVTNITQLTQVQTAGAQFAISPGATPALLEAGKGADIPLIPGIATVSELMMGIEYGYDRFKLFPAEAVGGVKLLKSIHGPFPDIRFCPTGGINESNYQDYLALPNVSCVGGSWIMPK